MQWPKNFCWLRIPGWFHFPTDEKTGRIRLFWEFLAFIPFQLDRVADKLSGHRKSATVHGTVLFQLGLGQVVPTLRL